MSDGVSPLPGFEIADVGLADLRAGRLSVEALAVLVLSHRLRYIGVDVPMAEVVDPEQTLFQLLSAQDGRGAHGRYLSLLRRLDSYARAAEHRYTATQQEARESRSRLLSP